MSIPIIKTFSLTAAGQVSASENITKAINASFNVRVGAIGTNIVLRAEFSLDNGITWSNCNTADTIITANSQVIVPVMGNNTHPPLVRLNWVSTSGGIPTVTGVLRMSV